MGYYLKGETLEYFSKHLKSCIKGKGGEKRKLYLYTDSSEAARYMGEIVKAKFDGQWFDPWPENNKNVTVKFEYVWQRDYAVEQVNKEVDAYRSTNSDSLLQGLEGDNAPLKEDDEETETNWTTYIIIGLAVVALVLLVWPKSKK